MSTSISSAALHQKNDSSNFIFSDEKEDYKNLENVNNRVGNDN